MGRGCTCIPFQRADAVRGVPLRLTSRPRAEPCPSRPTRGPSSHRPFFVPTQIESIRMWPGVSGQISGGKTRPPCEV